MNMYFKFNRYVSSQERQVAVGLEQATSFVLKRAKQLVQQLVTERGHNNLPFSSTEYAHLLGIKVVNKDLGRTSAVLLKLKDGYIIKVNQNHNLARRNFSCAHEIGHIIFNELKLDQYIRNIEYRKFNPQAEQKTRAAVRERLCDIAATELLMPEHIFSKYLSSFGISIRLIERLANTFMVSIQSAAIRIAEVSPEPCLALLWQPWPKSKPKGLRLGWRAGPRNNSQGRVNYMPVYELVKPPSTLHEAYESHSYTKSLRKFKIDNTTKRFLPIESKGFGHGETRYVLSLAFLDR